MQMRHIFSFLDVDRANCGVDRIDGSYFFATAVQILIGTDLSLLFFKSVPIDRSLTRQSDSFQECESADRRAFVDQCSVIQISQAEIFPPRSFFLTPMPVQELYH